MKRILSAVGSSVIERILSKEECEVIEDIPYQEGVLEFIKREFADVLVVSADIEGEMNRYSFIEKIREMDSKIKIIVIFEKDDEKFRDFLYEREITDVLTDGNCSEENLIKCILGKTTANARESVLRQENFKIELTAKRDRKNTLKPNLIPRFQRQKIITFAGISSSGKSTLLVQLAIILAKKTNAKVLIMDFDTINSGINMFLGEKREPPNPEYINSLDKNGGINYLIDAIDKRVLDCAIFEKNVIKSKYANNLFILTGNISLFTCKSVLNNEYYLRILEKAKELYDYILIDTSSNLFIDSTQFALLNANHIFFVAEPTYLSIDRTRRVLKDIFPIWGVYEKKIGIIINKYHKKSPEKAIINSLLREWEISGYIKLSEDYDLSLNLGKPLSLVKEEEFLHLLEKIDIIPKQTLFERIKMQYKAGLEVQDAYRSV